jgi:hypothetical protein
MAPASRRDEHAERRLRSLVSESGALVAWTRGWVSREVHAHRLLAARTLDFAVLTETDLFLYSSGFFTRRPRHLVYAADLDRTWVSDHPVAGGRRLSIQAGPGRPLRIELADTDRANTFADELLASARGEPL